MSEETVIMSALFSNYGLEGPLTCTCIRKSFNDHYLIQTAHQRFVLRVYINDKYYIKNLHSIHFELDLLEYLYANGIRVMAPIKNIDQCYLSVINLNGETRYMTLFPHAEGIQIGDKLNKEQSIKLGEIIANVHIASNQFKSIGTRYILDTNTLLEEPLHDIENYMQQFGLGNLSFFHHTKQVLIDKLQKIPKNRETYGIIHGDPNPSNYYYNEQIGFSLFDFDHCAYGYRIHDLSVVALCFPKEIYDQILYGYDCIRPLLDSEKDCIETYTSILQIKKIKDIHNMLEIQGASADEKEHVTKNAYSTLMKIVKES